MVIRYSEHEGAVTFSVRVVPRASRSEIAGELEGVLRVRVAAPPIDGAANEELIKTLARTLKVSRSSVEILSGGSSKNKRVRVYGADGAAIQNLVAAGSRG